VRAANTGISAIIDPYGRVVAELGLEQEGVIDGLLPKAISPTPYVRWGRWIELLVLALALCGRTASGPIRNRATHCKCFSI
jgi:apolipoprotein N-acyltransferase